MKFVMNYPHCVEFIIGNLGSFRVFIFIGNTFHGQSFARHGRPDEVYYHGKAYKRFPTPILADERKSRCSILFHLLVPGGKCSTVIFMASLFASFCNFSQFLSVRLQAIAHPPEHRGDACIRYFVAQRPLYVSWAFACPF
jgi:hypothetical protein